MTASRQILYNILKFSKHEKFIVIYIYIYICVDFFEKNKCSLLIIWIAIRCKLIRYIDFSKISNISLQRKSKSFIIVILICLFVRIVLTFFLLYARSFSYIIISYIIKINFQGIFSPICYTSEV